MGPFLHSSACKKNVIIGEMMKLVTRIFSIFLIFSFLLETGNAAALCPNPVRKPVLVGGASTASHALSLPAITHTFLGRFLSEGPIHLTLVQLSEAFLLEPAVVGVPSSVMMRSRKDGFSGRSEMARQSRSFIPTPIQASPPAQKASKSFWRRSTTWISMALISVVLLGFYLWPPNAPVVSSVTTEERIPAPSVDGMADGNPYNKEVVRKFILKHIKDAHNFESDIAGMQLPAGYTRDEVRSAVYRFVLFLRHAEMDYLTKGEDEALMKIDIHGEFLYNPDQLKILGKDPGISIFFTAMRMLPLQQERDTQLIELNRRLGLFLKQQGALTPDMFLPFPRARDDVWEIFRLNCANYTEASYFASAFRAHRAGFKDKTPLRQHLLTLPQNPEADLKEVDSLFTFTPGSISPINELTGLNQTLSGKPMRMLYVAARRASGDPTYTWDNLMRAMLSEKKFATDIYLWTNDHVLKRDSLAPRQLHKTSNKKLAKAA